MSEILMVVQIAQWIVLSLLVIVVLTLARQVGLLHRRLPPAPSRPLHQGLKIGISLADKLKQDLSGRVVSFAEGQKNTLLVFLTPTCQTCEELLPSLRTVTRSEKSRMQTIIACVGVEASARKYVQQHKLTLPVIAGPSLAEEFNVFSTPYAILIDERGVVLTEGLVNNLDHLEGSVPFSV